MGVRRAAVSVAGGASVLAGDATGPSGANTVVGLQNVPVSNSTPMGGDVLVYSGGQWVPGGVSGVGQPVGWYKTVYVDPSKGDDGTGVMADASKPFASIQKAWEDLQSNGVTEGSISINAGTIGQPVAIAYPAKAYGQGRGITEISYGGGDIASLDGTFTFSECSLKAAAGRAFNCNAGEGAAHATLTSIETFCDGVTEDVFLQNYSSVTLDNVKTFAGTYLLNCQAVTTFNHEETEEPALFQIEANAGLCTARLRNSTFNNLTVKSQINLVLDDDCVVGKNFDAGSVLSGTLSVNGAIRNNATFATDGISVQIGARIGGDCALQNSTSATTVIARSSFSCGGALVIGDNVTLDCTLMVGLLNPSTTQIGATNAFIINPRWMTFDTVNDAALNHIATLTESLVGMTNTNIGRTFELPGDARPGQRFGVKDRAGTAGVSNKHITVTDALGRSIDGAASIQVNKNWQTIWFEYDVSTDKWMVISST